MKYCFINRKPDSTRLIALFLGWAMDENPFLSLGRDGYDIVAFFGYETDEKTKEVYTKIVQTYSEVSVIAWSFGVAAANSILSEKEKYAIAVNGTPTPNHNLKGIPRHVLAITLRSLNAQNLNKFYCSISSCENTVFSNSLPQRNIDELRTELAMFSEMKEAAPSRFWKKVYIAECDAIIPPANQHRAWKELPVIVESVPKGEHYIDFQTIINNDIIDKNLVARRFTNNVASYETEATTQRKIASALMYLIRKTDFSFAGKRILELGAGTGFLTRIYGAESPSAESVAVDLADAKILTASFQNNSVCYPGTVITDDAEVFLKNTPTGKFDAILSSSAMQWFDDLNSMFSNIARILPTGGIAAFSTFLNGTFAEIKEVSGRTLSYPSVDYIHSLIPSSLQIVTEQTDELKEYFADGKSLLSHIRATGVNAVGSSTGIAETMKLIRQLDKNPVLTYCPYYFILQKK